MQLSQTDRKAWQAEEVSLWYRSVRRTLLVGLLIGPPLRLLKMYWSESKLESWAFHYLAVGSFLYGLYVWFSPVTEEWKRRVQVTVMINVLQVYFIAAAVFVTPGCLGVWPFVSATLFFLYEIRSFSSRLTNFLVLLKHCCAWNFATRYSNQDSHCELPWIPIPLIFFVIYMAMTELEAKTERYYQFCETCKQQETNLRTILMSIPEGVGVITNQHELVCHNDQFRQLLQFTSATQIIDKLKATFPLKNIQTVTETDVSIWSKIECFLSEEKQEAVFGVTVVNSRYYEWKSTRCTWESVSACILSVSDISTWVASQHRLQQESEIKTSLIRFASHELRTPANAIVNLAQRLMSSTQLGPEQKEEMHVVRVNTQLLVLVVNDLLDFTRIQLEKLTLVKQNFDIRKLVREMASLVDWQCRRKGIELLVNTDSLVPETIYSDPSRLQQILLNLLKNAVRYTFHGAIRVICSLSAHNSLKICVKDTGIGLSPTQQQALRAAFQGIETDIKVPPREYGLGLYISNVLAVNLGFRAIDVSSQQGVGSEFCFEVALRLDDTCALTQSSDWTLCDIEEERQVESAVPASEVSGGMSLTNTQLASVLIVDDSEFNRLVLKKLLASLNIRADEAFNGLHALSLVRTALHRGQSYRVILMDVEMPEMDGIEATRLLREMERRGELMERLKIVGCSAHRSREDIERCLSAGMDSYLEKPVNSTMLREELID